MKTAPCCSAGAEADQLRMGAEPVERLHDDAQRVVAAPALLVKPGRVREAHDIVGREPTRGFELTFRFVVSLEPAQHDAQEAAILAVRRLARHEIGEQLVRTGDVIEGEADLSEVEPRGVVARVLRNRALVAGDSLGRTALVLQREAEHVPLMRVRGVRREALARVGLRVDVASRLKEQDRELAAHAAEEIVAARNDRLGFPEMPHRIVTFAGADRRAIAVQRRPECETHRSVLK